MVGLLPHGFAVLLAPRILEELENVGFSVPYHDVWQHCVALGELCEVSVLAGTLDEYARPGTCVDTCRSFHVKSHLARMLSRLNW